MSKTTKEFGHDSAVKVGTNMGSEEGWHGHVPLLAGGVTPTGGVDRNVPWLIASHLSWDDGAIPLSVGGIAPIGWDDGVIPGLVGATLSWENCEIPLLSRGVAPACG